MISKVSENVYLGLNFLCFKLYIFYSFLIFDYDPCTLMAGECLKSKIFRFEMIFNVNVLCF